jgi:hypothetical protein
VTRNNRPLNAWYFRHPSTSQVCPAPRTSASVTCARNHFPFVVHLQRANLLVPRVASRLAAYLSGLQRVLVSFCSTFATLLREIPRLSSVVAQSATAICSKLLFPASAFQLDLVTARSRPKSL